MKKMKLKEFKKSAFEGPQPAAKFKNSLINNFKKRIKIVKELFRNIALDKPQSARLPLQLRPDLRERRLCLGAEKDF